VSVEEKPTCDGLCDPTGRCDPKHPMHCCHFVLTYRSGPWQGYRCAKCGKLSKAFVKASSGEGPAI